MGGQPYRKDARPDLQRARGAFRDPRGEQSLVDFSGGRDADLGRETGSVDAVDGGWTSLTAVCTDGQGQVGWCTARSYRRFSALMASHGANTRPSSRWSSAFILF